jgi:two-component system sporulation sensor kinase B
MYIAMMMIMLSTAIMLLLKDYKSEWTKYLAGIFFLSSLAALSTAADDFTTYLIKQGLILTPVLQRKIYRIFDVCSQLAENFNFFLLVSYCISYSRLFKRKVKSVLILFFLAYSSVSFLLTPIMQSIKRSDKYIYMEYYRKLTLIYTPVFLFGLIVLFISYFREKNPGIKGQRKMNLLFGLPMCFSVAINLFIARAIGIGSVVQLNAIIILVLLMIFLFAIFRFGLFGIRLRVERLGFNTDLESISHGTAMFNHTLKNEISKIAISTENIKNDCEIQCPDAANIQMNIEILENASHRLRKVVGRLKDFSDEIILKESIIVFPDLINQALVNVKPAILEKRIRILEDYDYSVQILCDVDHMVEAITNILKNACEAVGEEGVIKIYLYGNQKLVFLSIADNGSGIKKEHLTKVFEPFFSTKSTANENFGLGLSYCCRVMSKHHCSINIYSREDSETSVVLTIPGFRIVKYKKELPQRSS